LLYDHDKISIKRVFQKSWQKFTNTVKVEDGH